MSIICRQRPALELIKNLAVGALLVAASGIIPYFFPDQTPDKIAVNFDQLRNVRWIEIKSATANQLAMIDPTHWPSYSYPRPISHAVTQQPIPSFAISRLAQDKHSTLTFVRTIGYPVRWLVGSWHVQVTTKATIYDGCFRRSAPPDQLEVLADKLVWLESQPDIDRRWRIFFTPISRYDLVVYHLLLGKAICLLVAMTLVVAIVRIAALLTIVYLRLEQQKCALCGYSCGGAPQCPECGNFTMDSVGKIEHER